MKKTMFITSVVMVIVMAIALTTSSLAWFSASGASTVETNAFQVTAKSETVEGLAISKNGADGTWDSTVTLTASGINLMPLVPLTGASHFDENADPQWDFDEDDFVATFVDSSTHGETGGWDVNMIGNKLGNNSIYKGTAYDAGYFEDNFFITNTATGSTAKAVNLNCTIAFYCPTNDGEGNPLVYNSTNRTANVYALDATLNVAVFYALNRFDADGSSADDTDDSWALLAFGTSKGAATVNLGRTEASFAEGEASGSSVGPWTYTANLANHTRYTTDDALNAIRPARAYNGAPVVADKMEIKVVAWYDGPSLINNNAANGNLRFGLTFGKQASTYAD